MDAGGFVVLAMVGIGQQEGSVPRKRSEVSGILALFLNGCDFRKASSSKMLHDELRQESSNAAQVAAAPVGGCPSDCTPSPPTSSTG